MDRRLYRSRRERVWTGVAGGVALWMNADPSIVRVAWVILTFLTGGLALVLYIVMAIVVPEAPARRAPATTPGADVGPGEATDDEPVGEVTPSEVWEEEPLAERRGDGNGALIGGVILIGLGLFFLLRQYLDFDWGRFWPIVLIALGALVLFGSLNRRREG